MTSFMDNWWREHDMDQDAKGCGLLAMFGCLVVIVLGASFMGFLIWSLIL